MAALTSDRNTLRRAGDQLEPLMAASTRIYGGGIVAMNAAGFATKGATSTTLKTLGVAELGADNSAGLDGAARVKVRKGVFKFGNSASTDQITLADLKSDCYVVDDQTVARTSGGSTRSVAGRVFDVELDGGVWVEFT